MKQKIICSILGLVIFTLIVSVAVHSDAPVPPEKPRLPTTLAFRKAQYDADQEFTSGQAPYIHTPKLGDDLVFKSSLRGGIAPLNGERLRWPSQKERVENFELSKEKEIDERIHWVGKLVSGSFEGNRGMRGDLIEHLIFFHDAKTGDDGIGTRYQFNGLTVQILERRDLLTIFEPIKPTRFGSLPKMDLPEKERLKAIEQYVGRVFRVATPYPLQIRVNDSIFVNSRLIEGGAQGQIKLIGNAPHWFLRPFDWWTDGQAVAFRVDKVFPARNGGKYSIGLDGYDRSYGYTQDDPRPFNRFSKDFKYDFDQEIQKYSAEIAAWEDSRWFKPKPIDKTKPIINNLPQPPPRPMPDSENPLKWSQEESERRAFEEEENFRKNVLGEK